MPKTDAMNAATLRSLLDYDPVTGIFTWRVSQGTRVKGSRAGSTGRPDGYRYIAINKTLYRASRLAWMHVYGHWPDCHVDHINGDTDDDRFANLREATRSQNLGNRKRNSNNTTGFKGVAKKGEKYIAYINHDGSRHHLGSFDRPETAHAAYCKKASELFGRFARAQ